MKAWKITIYRASVPGETDKVWVDCCLRGELSCRWDSKVLSLFVLKEIPPIVVALFGMIMVGIMFGL